MLKKILIAACFALAVCFSGVAAHAQVGGGFQGPSVSASTVEQAKTMRDDTYVTLQGNIVQHLGGDRYLFQDNTGNITVDIDNHKWAGQNITPNDKVEIQGEVDKDWNSVEIDVDLIRKI